MMWGYGIHDFGFGMLFMWAVPLLFFVGLVAVVVKLLNGKDRKPPTARELLDEAYARGEISREEYLQKREDLER